MLTKYEQAVRQHQIVTAATPITSGTPAKKGWSAHSIDPCKNKEMQEAERTSVIAATPTIAGTPAKQQQHCSDRRDASDSSEISNKKNACRQQEIRHVHCTLVYSRVTSNTTTKLGMLATVQRQHAGTQVTGATPCSNSREPEVVGKSATVRDTNVIKGCQLQ
jgi:hypothetical protein